MKLILSSSNAFDIEASHMYLRGGCPVVNSLVLQDVQVEVILDEPDRQIFRYRSSILGNGTFSLEIRHDKASDRLWLQYWIEGLAPSQALDSFGLQFQETENLLSYLRNGYTTWDGSTYVDVEAMTDFGHHENRPKTGYAMI